MAHVIWRYGASVTVITGLQHVKNITQEFEVVFADESSDSTERKFVVRDDGSYHTLKDMFRLETTNPGDIALELKLVADPAVMDDYPKTNRLSAEQVSLPQLRSIPCFVLLYTSSGATYMIYSPDILRATGLQRYVRVDAINQDLFKNSETAEILLDGFHTIIIPPDRWDEFLDLFNLEDIKDKDSIIGMVMYDFIQLF